MTEHQRPLRVVELVEYDPSWPARFAVERDLLAGALPDALAVEHIGSTSVPGLCAKPTIDVLLVVADPATVLDRLDALGYEYRPGSFAEDGTHLFLRKVAKQRRTHHLHVLTAGSPRIDEYLLFRDYLRADAAATARYAEVKRELAVRYAHDRGRYVAEKSGVVTELLERARRWRADG
jgi:GrpB-like predicted nucleotidyltransferase (UPF0157 family)